jgi:CheY-like chemotaxis protein
MANRLALIIEDNPDIAEVYRLTLSMVTYDTEVVDDGKAALDRLIKGTVPDLIILDMNLPQVSGHYIYNNIRANPNLDQVPVIISTANAVVANAMQADLAPIDHLIVKPVSARELKTLVEQL